MLKSEIICDCCNTIIDKNNKFGRIRIEQVGFFGSIYKQMDICENCWNKIQEIQKKNEV